MGPAMPIAWRLTSRFMTSTRVPRFHRGKFRCFVDSRWKLGKSATNLRSQGRKLPWCYATGRRFCATFRSAARGVGAARSGGYCPRIRLLWSLSGAPPTLPHPPRLVCRSREAATCSPTWPDRLQRECSCRHHFPHLPCECREPQGGVTLAQGCQDAGVTLEPIGLAHWDRTSALCRSLSGGILGVAATVRYGCERPGGIPGGFRVRGGGSDHRAANHGLSSGQLCAAARAGSN
jgi:hypothetical protein